MQPLFVCDYTLTTALGRGVNENWEKIAAGQTGLSARTLQAETPVNTWVGEVSGVDQVILPEEHLAFNCRNNRLAYLALQQDSFAQKVEALKNKFGVEDIGIFIGTSTSGIRQTELAYENRNSEGELPDDFDYRRTHNCFSAVDFFRSVFGLKGYAVSISTACSSSAKVFASAARAIESGLCKAAIVGGVDTICDTTLFGFNALQLVSDEPCRPFDTSRKGISIGEGAGFAILQPQEEGITAKGLLLGYGESSDAYHMSSPHPDGIGALLAMQSALDRAGLPANKIDYINMHGTGTRANDSAEVNAVLTLGADAKCSSIKAWTGHTLGAAGIVEAIVVLESIRNNFVPKSLNAIKLDEVAANLIALESQEQDVSIGMTNSFGFGGTNCSLVFGE